MTREESLATKTWVTEDGRYLHVTEIDDGHLHNIKSFVEDRLHGVRANDALADDAIDGETYWCAWLTCVQTEQQRRANLMVAP